MNKNKRLLLSSSFLFMTLFMSFLLFSCSKKNEGMAEAKNAGEAIVNGVRLCEEVSYQRIAFWTNAVSGGQDWEKALADFDEKTETKDSLSRLNENKTEVFEKIEEFNSVKNASKDLIMLINQMHSVYQDFVRLAESANGNLASYRDQVYSTDNRFMPEFQSFKELCGN